MNRRSESTPRASPDTDTPGSEPTQRSAKSALLAGALLTVSLVMALGALSGTAAAETSSTDAGEAIASTQQMATDMIEAAENSAVVNASSAGSTAASSSDPIKETIAKVSAKVTIAEVSAKETIAEVSAKETIAEVSAVIEELELTASQSFGSLSISESEVTRLMSSLSMDDEVSAMAEPAPDSISQCNDGDVTQGAGREVTCSVTIENNTSDEGDKSSVVTTSACEGEANMPPETCNTTGPTTYDDHVTSVDQCNGILAGGSNVYCDVTVTNSGPVGTNPETVTVNQCNGSAVGGGSNVACDVEIINRIPEGTPTEEVTVRQCVGSGEGGGIEPTTDCDPPADSSISPDDATVAQCNGSANNGGDTERVRCDVTGLETAVPLDIDQCNGSTAGGSTVICTTSIENEFVEEPDDGNGDNGNGDNGNGDNGNGDNGNGDNGNGDNGNGDDEPGIGGPVTGGPGTTVPESISPVGLAAAPSQPSPAGVGTTTETPSSATGPSTLPVTGSGIGSMTALALLAMMLGGLMILISRSKATAKN